MGESIRVAIEDLFGSDGEPLQSAILLITKAEVIAILERSSGQKALIYGLDLLHRQIERIDTASPLMLLVDFDERSENLAKLFSLIQKIKAQQ